jgi:hypothetical protein
MDRIIYWQLMQKQTCTTQSTDGDSVRPAEGSQRTVESTNHGLITFLLKHDVLFCTQCKVIVPSNDLDSHLRASTRVSESRFENPFAKRSQMFLK